jgi:parvulin-like peptidyl-prolyl isomerase
MANILVGNQTILNSELLYLLAGSQLIPPLHREYTINKAISAIKLTAEEHLTAVEQFYLKNQLTTPDAITAVLSHYCMTQEQLEALATKELRIEKFKQATWSSKLEQYFLQHKSQLDKVLYSLLRVQELEVAQELYFRIKAGEASFADCASEYSQGGEAQTGGLIGPVPLSQPHPIIAQKLNTSQPGQLWTPIKLENWYVIVRLEKLVAAQFDDATKATLLNHLFEQWLTEELARTPISISNNIPSILPVPLEDIPTSPQTHSPLPTPHSPVLVTQ